MGLQGKVNVSASAPAPQPAVTAPTDTKAATPQNIKATDTAQTGAKASENVSHETSKPTEPTKYRVKVDGKEMDVTLDDLTKDYQLKATSYKRLEETARRQKELEAREAKWRDNPWDVFKESGQDPDALAEQRLAEKIRREMMSPAERQAAEMKRERDEAVAKARMYEEEKRQYAHAQEKAKYAQEYETQIVEALNTTGLPKHERTIALMAQYMENAMKLGLDVTAKDVAPMVKDHFQKDLYSVISSMDADALTAMFPDIGDKIRKADVAKLKNKVTSKSDADAPKPTAQKKEKMAIRDYFEKKKAELQ